MSRTVNFVFDRQFPNAGKKQSVKGREKKILKHTERGGGEIANSTKRARIGLNENYRMERDEILELDREWDRV